MNITNFKVGHKYNSIIEVPDERTERVKNKFLVVAKFKSDNSMLVLLDDASKETKKLVKDLMTELTAAEWGNGIFFNDDTDVPESVQNDLEDSLVDYYFTKGKLYTTLGFSIVDVKEIK